MQKPVLIASAALICAAVIGIAVYATGSAKKDAGGFAGYPPVKVALASVERRVVPRVFDGVGELEAGRQVQVAAEAAGRITRIAFESGQQVQQGQLLVQLNDAVEQAELIRLKAQLRNAEILHARARKLVERNVASQEQLDNAVAARDMALGAVRQTQALIDQKAISAPFSGQLGIRRVHLGQYLGAPRGPGRRLSGAQLPGAHQRHRPADRQVAHGAGPGLAGQPRRPARRRHVRQHPGLAQSRRAVAERAGNRSHLHRLRRHRVRRPPVPVAGR